jgi:hypothetical protein
MRGGVDEEAFGDAVGIAFADGADGGERALIVAELRGIQVFAPLGEVAAGCVRGAGG